MESFPPSRSTSRHPINGLNGMSISTNALPGAGGTEYESTPVGPEAHAAIHIGRCALITGAASGIGLAAAKEFAHYGLRVVLADANEEDLKAASLEVSAIAGPQNVLAIKTDVSKLDEVERLRDQVFEHYGEINILMNNAGTSAYGGAVSNANPDNWRKAFDVNLFGVVNMVQTFAPGMIHQENPSLIINTGSKQGLTNPPGNAAYNASKAAVRILTENLAHELASTGSKVTAHLFVPGWTYTKMTGAKSINGQGVKPAGAWTAEETVKYMLDKVKDGKFYIICPDNETSEDLDRLRIKWASGDVVEGRPALSRWHPQWKAAFEEYVASGLHYFANRGRRGKSQGTESGHNSS